MAPHALYDLNDISGYYPSTAHKIWAQPLACRKSSKAFLPELEQSTKIPIGNLGFGSESPKNVWNLSSDEISEIEKNVRDFLSMRETCPTAYIIYPLIRPGFTA